MKTIDMKQKGIQDWLSYGIAVAKSRAIPYAEDNLKPVQRRILYVMSEMKLWDKAKTMKSARVVGEVMGKYHPHGDMSIYAALIHMSQAWKTRYPLIYVQGNNGSLNGDGPAASRYTECKLTPAGEYLLKGIDPDVLPFHANYDDTTIEPDLLPSIFPNVLCNGSLGIAVGMSCSLLPHNLNEVCDLLKAIVKGDVHNTKDAMTILHGPDFPLGGVVIDGSKLLEAYETGRGTITLRAKYEIDAKNNTITFSEFPYLVDVETRIIKAIKNMAADGYPDIENVENHIGKNTCNIKVILTKRANPQKVVQDLFEKTPLQKTQTINNTVILSGRPMTMSLIGLCNNYIRHQHNVIIKTATKEKAKQDKINFINKGLLKAVASIDEVIKIVRNSNSKDDARQQLVALLGIESEQADAILALQLGRLTKLESHDIQIKVDNSQKESDRQATIINDKAVRDVMICANLDDMKAKFGDSRRTTIITGEAEAVIADKKNAVPANMAVVLNDGSLVDIEVEKFPVVFKKGEQLSKYKPVMWVYNDKKPVSIVQKDGTTHSIFNPEDGRSLFVWDKDRQYIVTVSKKGIMKKSLMADYKKVDKLCRQKVDDEIMYAFCCDDSDSIICLLDNGKLQSIKVEDIKLSSKLTIGKKETTAPVVQACRVAKDGLFYTVDNENHCKKTAASDLSSTTVSINEGCEFIGEVHDNMFWFDGSKVIPIDWTTISVKSRTSKGSKLGNKKLNSIG